MNIKVTQFAGSVLNIFKSHGDRPNCTIRRKRHGKYIEKNLDNHGMFCTYLAIFHDVSSGAISSLVLRPWLLEGFFLCKFISLFQSWKREFEQWKKLNIKFKKRSNTWNKLFSTHKSKLLFCPAKECIQFLFEKFKT